MNDKLIPYYCKLPVYLKDKLEEQAKLERTSMVSILQELLILGLSERSRMMEANMLRLEYGISKENLTDHLSTNK